MLPRPTQPYFVFPDIPGFGDFSFEKLSVTNFEQLYLMLRDDESPFTDERFKQFDKAKEYAEQLQEYGAYSAKHSGQDWLFLYQNQYAGIFHLYDLSLETWDENHRRCWVGFATRPDIRRQGITKKAFGYFIRYILDNYPLIKYIHAMTLNENVPAKALLTSVGFKDDDPERMSKKHAFYLIEK